ncbi:unnamed protein product [Amaranthus hypochondriacus]
MEGCRCRSPQFLMGNKQPVLLGLNLTRKDNTVQHKECTIFKFQNILLLVVQPTVQEISGLLIVTTFSVVDLEGYATRYETNFHLFFPPYSALARYDTSYKVDLCTVALLSRAEHPRQEQL